LITENVENLNFNYVKLIMPSNQISSIKPENNDFPTGTLLLSALANKYGLAEPF